MSNANFLHAAGLLCVLGLAACGRTACQNHITQAAPAPDGAAFAFVFDHDCGPRGVSTHVSLIAQHDALRAGTGNVLALTDRQPVKITWRSPTDLVVSGFDNPAFVLDKPWGRVTVEFHDRLRER